MAPWPNALEEQPEELDEDYYNQDNGDNANDNNSDSESPAPLLQQYDIDQPAVTASDSTTTASTAAAAAVPLRTAPAQLQFGDSANWERVTLQLHTDTLLWQHDDDSSSTAELQLSAVSAVQAQGGGDAGVLLLGRGSSSEVLLRLRGDSESASEEWRAAIDSALAELRWGNGVDIV
jgi:hypothetical protein